MQQDILEIRNLQAQIEDKEILKGINLTIKSGEIHAIMGPNGSGKSTFCNILMGHPKYEVTAGQILFNSQDILELAPNERAALGLFSSFQHPTEVPGVTFTNFLRTAKNALAKERGQTEHIDLEDFVDEMKSAVGMLQMPEHFMERAVNQGFSGGEKKRAEIMQMAILKPRIAFLDEIDSGLDIDALRVVAAAVQETFNQNHPGLLLITHYQRILNYITPHFVHIIHDGRIIKSGDKTLALELEANGYQNFINA